MKKKKIRNYFNHLRSIKLYVYINLKRNSTQDGLYSQFARVIKSNEPVILFKKCDSNMLRLNRKVLIFSFSFQLPISL